MKLVATTIGIIKSRMNHNGKIQYQIHRHIMKGLEILLILIIQEPILMSTISIITGIRIKLKYWIIKRVIASQRPEKTMLTSLIEKI